MAVSQTRKRSGRPAPAARLMFRDGILVQQNHLAKELLGAYPAGVALADIVEGAIGHGIPTGDLLEITRADGVTMHVGGSWDGQTLTVRDRTADYHIRNQQVRMVQMLEDAQRLGHLGSWSWDVAKDEVYWSDEMYRLFDLEPQSEDMNYKAFLQLIHPEDRDSVDAKIGKAFEAGGMYTVRHRVLLADGSVRHVFGQGIVEKNADGQALRIWGTSQDITAQEEALEVQRLALLRGLEIEHLKELDRAKTQLLNTASHELNTPLTPLKLQLHLLSQNQEGLSERQKRALAVLSRNVQRLAMLVADVLDVARITSGHLKIVPQPANTKAILQDSIAAFEATAKEKNITIANNVTGYDVVADPDRIAQVVDNLLSNALKFTPDGGEVVLADRLEGEDWCVQVKDSGIGLTPQQIEQLFQPFSQVHDVAKFAERGTGLGLYICQGIAEGHGGTMTMSSDGPGTGTTVMLCIPREARIVNQAANDY